LQTNDLLSVGTVVDNSIQIGTMGNTNQADGTHQGNMGEHLHFEVRKETNVNSGFGVGGEVWWPETVTKSYNFFVDLSPIFGQGAAFDEIP
jgi:murein DD-endopeptidase MepM/ murein hydrolase activator NlpD